MGMLFTCYPLFIGEISEPTIRGGLVGLIVNGIPLGTLLGNVMGANLVMFSYGIISLTLTLIYVGCFPFLPPSPYYYIKRHDIERCITLLFYMHNYIASLIYLVNRLCHATS
jgi:SP family facilitated glucose transporter-like MFS transporter 8